MLKLTCPYCGVEGEETEFAPLGEAHIERDLGDDVAFADYLFTRKNPKGVHFERWRHAYGCGKFFHVARCTVTLEVFGTYEAQTMRPPDALLEKIKAKRPDWPGFGDV